MLKHLVLENFTVFEKIDLGFVPGINIFIGENGTGKTHLLKLLYSILAAENSRGKNNETTIDKKLARVFLPLEKNINRLARRINKSTIAKFELYADDGIVNGEFSSHKNPGFKSNGSLNPGYPIYIPVKEVLANAPGFRSVYKNTSLNFEEVYYDIIDMAFLELRRGPTEAKINKLLEKMEGVIEGKIVHDDNEVFYLKNKQGSIEFTLLAEGIRKLALILILIKNGLLIKGETLFWDEPEANLNPKMFQALVSIILQLQELGVQIFIATHSYDLLREFDLQAQENHIIRYNTIFREDGKIRINTATAYDNLNPNAIEESNKDRLYRGMDKAMGI